MTNAKDLYQFTGLCSRHMGLLEPVVTSSDAVEHVSGVNQATVELQKVQAAGMDKDLMERWLQT